MEGWASMVDCRAPFSGRREMSLSGWRTTCWGGVSLRGFVGESGDGYEQCIHSPL